MTIALLVYCAVIVIGCVVALFLPSVKGGCSICGGPDCD